MRKDSLGFLVLDGRVSVGLLEAIFMHELDPRPKNLEVEEVVD